MTPEQSAARSAATGTGTARYPQSATATTVGGNPSSPALPAPARSVGAPGDAPPLDGALKEFYYEELQHVADPTFFEYGGILYNHLLPRIEPAGRPVAATFAEVRAVLLGMLVDGRSGSLVRKARRLLLGALRRAHGQSPYPLGPGTIPKVKERLTTEEAAGLLLRAHQEDRVRFAMYALALCGVRLDEQLALTWEDVGSHGYYLPVRRVRKGRPAPGTGASRRPATEVVLIDHHRWCASSGLDQVWEDLDTRARLAGLPEPDPEFVFGLPDGRLPDPNQLRAQLARDLDALRLPQVAFDDLRRTPPLRPGR